MHAFLTFLPVLQDFVKLNNNLGGLSFGQDADGNWGYKIGGADTVNPFSNGTYYDPTPFNTDAAYRRYPCPLYDNAYKGHKKYLYICVSDVYNNTDAAERYTGITNVKDTEITILGKSSMSGSWQWKVSQIIVTGSEPTVQANLGTTIAFVGL